MTGTNEGNSVVCLRIIGESLDSTLISSRLGISAKSVRRKGERHLGHTQEQDVVIYEVAPRSSRELSDQLTVLQEALTPALDFLTELKKTANVHVYCSFVTDWAQSGFAITPGSIKKFVDAGLNIEISIFSWGLVEGGEDDPEQQQGPSESALG